MVTHRPYAHLRAQYLESLSTLTTAQDNELAEINWYFELCEMWEDRQEVDLAKELSGCAGAIDGTDPNYYD